MKLTEYKLTGWQKDVINAIEVHPTLRESEQYQGVPDFLVNKELHIVASFPSNEPGAIFTNCIASKYAAIVIYRDIKHYVALSSSFELHPDTDMLSMFEISYALTESNSHINIEDLKQRFLGKRVVVVDGGESLPLRVKSFLLEASPTLVVFLGK